MIQIFNEDNMNLMARYPDKYFNLAIVDPPYGSALPSIEGGGGGPISVEIINPPLKNRRRSLIGGGFDKLIKRSGGTWDKKYGDKIEHWDIAPNEDYFRELFRVSDKVFIWGGNYFDLPPSRNFVIWRKISISESFSMAMVEYAWTNIWGNAKCFEYAPQDKFRFHPTQKPAALYRWLLSRYAKPGWQILDTHLGSGTHAIACLDLGYDLTACEIDEDYFNQCVKMIREHTLQGNLFSPDGGPLPSEPKNEKSLFD